MSDLTIKKLENFSYTPYSELPDVCVVKSEKNIFYPGVRVENISYPLTISAIQAAIFSCLANEDKPQKVIVPKLENDGKLFNWWVELFNLQVEENPTYSFKPVNLIRTFSSTNDVLHHLNDLCKKAVVLNSNFPVSCLIETKDGFIPGVNIEVASWELGLCAERVAISRALSFGYTEFGMIHIYAPKSDYVSPCGACRQVLLEHGEHSVTRLYQNEQEFMDVNISNLLPYHFKSDSLKKY